MLFAIQCTPIVVFKWELLDKETELFFKAGLCGIIQIAMGILGNQNFDIT